MTDKALVLLIGGPFDGKRVAVERGLPYITLREVAPPKTDMFTAALPAVADVDYITHEYFQMDIAGTLMGKQTYHSIYAHSGMKNSDIMEILINGYKRR